MKKEIREAFEKALAEHEARTAAAQQQKEQRLSDRQRFEAECRRVRNTVIIPALNEVANEILRPAGWRCQVRSNEEDLEATLEIARHGMVASAQMTASGRVQAPHITFRPDSYTPKLAIYAASVFQSGPEGIYDLSAVPEGKYDLSAVTADFVHEQVARFFARLASGR